MLRCKIPVVKVYKMVCEKKVLLSASKCLLMNNIFYFVRLLSILFVHANKM